VKTEDFSSTNLDLDYTRITFYRQWNMVVCIYLITTVTFANTLDHTVIEVGKIPQAFRPTYTTSETNGVNYVDHDIISYTGTVRHGLIRIGDDGSMKIRMGASNTNMNIYGSFTYIVEDE
jgi:hypothetical protein